MFTFCWPLFRIIPSIPQIPCRRNLVHFTRIQPKMSPQQTDDATKKTLKPESRNIEIKARLGSDEQFERRIQIARKLTGTEGELIPQHDVFYNVAEGRLKLRFLKNAPAQLVQYSRPDVAGPKLSQFDVLPIAEPDILNRMLTASLGAKGEVRKVRHLFLHQQTRIHLDRVEGLGNFLEFEVCLREEQTIEEGAGIAQELRLVFDIQDGDLLQGAYLDDLQKKQGE